jgi:hypothetical protein
MGRVTFQDSEVIRRINKEFCATWRNVHPGYRVEHLEGARFEEVKQIPNGQASENVVTLFCTADGELLHVVPGHWKPNDYAKEIDFALSVAEAAARAGANPEARREAVREKHRSRLAALDQGWKGGELGRLVMQNAHRRMIQEPLRNVSLVRGVEDYALNPANSRLAQKIQPGPPEAIRRKIQRASALAERWRREGKDLTPVAQVMNAVEPLLRQGRFAEAETVLDRGLHLLGDTEKSDAGQLERPTREAGSLLTEPASVPTCRRPAGVRRREWLKRVSPITSRLRQRTMG